jgi:hypothetical protein
LSGLLVFEVEWPFSSGYLTGGPAAVPAAFWASRRAEKAGKQSFKCYTLRIFKLPLTKRIKNPQ